jgi:hypothetical protein
MFLRKGNIVINGWFSYLRILNITVLFSDKICVNLRDLREKKFPADIADFRRLKIMPGNI